MQLKSLIKNEEFQDISLHWSEKTCLVHDHLYLLRIRINENALRCICVNLKLKGKSWSRRLMCGQFAICILGFHDTRASAGNHVMRF